MSRDQHRLRHWPISEEYSNFAKAKPERLSDDVTRKIRPLDFTFESLDYWLLLYMVFSTSIPSWHTEGVFTKQLPIWNNLWWYWVSPLCRLDNSHYQVWCIDPWEVSQNIARLIYIYINPPLTSLDWKHQCRLWKMCCDVCTAHC